MGCGSSELLELWTAWLGTHRARAKVLGSLLATSRLLEICISMEVIKTSISDIGFVVKTCCCMLVRSSALVIIENNSIGSIHQLRSPRRCIRSWMRISRWRPWIRCLLGFLPSILAAVFTYQAFDFRMWKYLTNLRWLCDFALTSYIVLIFWNQLWERSLAV